MPQPSESSFDTPSTLQAPAPVPIPAVKRLFGRWWRRQSPARQDRFATLGPLLSVLLFLAAIISAFWYLRNEEIERESESVKRDTEIAQQQIRLRLIENQEQLVRMAREIVTRELEAPNFLAQSTRFTSDRPEIVYLSWIGADRRVRARQSSFGEREDMGVPAKPAPAASSPDEADWAFIAARDVRQPMYSRPFKDPTGAMVGLWQAKQHQGDEQQATGQADLAEHAHIGVVGDPVQVGVIGAEGESHGEARLGVFQREGARPRTEQRMLGNHLAADDQRGGAAAQRGVGVGTHSLLDEGQGLDPLDVLSGQCLEGQRGADHQRQ